MKKIFFILASVLCASASAQTIEDSKFTQENIREAIEHPDFNFSEYVYILHDIDGDGNPEMFIKEKVKCYNAYWALMYNDEGAQVIDERSSGGYEDFAYTSDGYFWHYEEHTGGFSQCESYYKLQNSKVVKTLRCHLEREIGNEEKVTVEYYIDDKKVKDKAYTAATPQGTRFNLYNLEGWKEFESPVSESFIEKGNSVEALVPKGWDKVSSAKGDINHDGHDDLVIIATPNNPDGIYEREDGFMINMNSPLVGIFYGQADGTYQLLRHDSSIVPQQSETFFVDGSGVTINAKGAITISYSTFSSAGSWTNDTNRYVYRYQDGDIYCIGQELSGMNRADHSTTIESYNFLTNKKCTRIVPETGKAREKWSDIEKQPLQLFGGNGDMDE